MKGYFQRLFAENWLINNNSLVVKENNSNIFLSFQQIKYLRKRKTYGCYYSIVIHVFLM